MQCTDKSRADLRAEARVFGLRMQFSKSVEKAKDFFKYEIQAIESCIRFNIDSTRTNIHNWSLKPFSQDYNLISHITYIACVDFYT